MASRRTSPRPARRPAHDALPAIPCDGSPQAAAVFEALRGLGWPPGRWVLVGSAPLAVHGIRPAADVDIVVDAQLYAALESDRRFHTAWRRCGQSYLTSRLSTATGTEFDVELFSETNIDRLAPAVAVLLETAELVSGMPCADLVVLSRWKRAVARRQDIADAESIAAHVELCLCASRTTV